MRARKLLLLLANEGLETFLVYCRGSHDAEETLKVRWIGLRETGSTLEALRLP